MELKYKRLEEFEKILKKYDDELYVYFNPKKEIQLSSLDPKELYSAATKWSKLSEQGLVCGILGCSDEPNVKCKMCKCSYCSEHLSWHFHSRTNTGILEKDSSEMR